MATPSSNISTMSLSRMTRVFSAASPRKGTVTMRQKKARHRGKILRNVNGVRMRVTPFR